MPYLPNERDAKRRRLIFALCALGYLAAVFQRLCPAVLAADMLRDLSASGAGIGVLGSAYFYPYAAMQLPAGLLVDSWGPRKTFAAFFCLAALGGVGMGMSETLGQAVFWRVCAGLGVATVFVASLKLLAVWYRPESFAAMAGWLLAMGGAGSLAATSPLALAAEKIGWRGAFAAVGVLCAALAVLAYACIKNAPDPAKTAAGACRNPDRPPLGRAMLTVLSRRHFWPLAGWIFFAQAIPFAFAGLWGGPYLRHVHGLSLTESGNVLSLAAAGLIAGGPALGNLAGRFGRKTVLAATAAGQALVITPIVLNTAGIDVRLLYALFFGLGFCGTAAAGVAFTSVKELYELNISGTATGLLNIFPFCAGALFQPLLGSILERHGRTAEGAFTAAGYQTAFAVLLGCAVAAAVCALFARETLKRPVRLLSQ